MFVVIMSEVIDGYKYEVVLDDNETFDMDFETPEQKADYIEQFDKGLMTSYGVIKFEKCKCCDSWNQINALWSLHFESAPECLKYYLENY